MISRKVIKVFLASPGDLADERKAAKEVVEEFNEQLADTYGCQIELVGWEATLPGYNRPQAIINRELEQCDMLVGMMWKRWGTPSDIDGTFSSGFEEEFTLARRRCEREGKPEIVLLFKDVDPEFLKDPGEGLSKVLAFKQQMIEEKKLLFHTFADGKSFEKRLRASLNGLAQQLLAVEKSKESGEAQSAAAANQLPPSAPVAADSKSPVSVEGAVFARQLLDKMDGHHESLDAAEIARFRLLGTLVRIQGNDDVVLGVHDANVLYEQRDRFTFGNAEIIGLVDSGLWHVKHHNVPLWCWVARMGIDLLPTMALVATSEARVGALQVMRLMGMALTSDPDQRAEYVCEGLLADDVSVKVALLEYLADWGIAADIPYLRKEVTGTTTTVTRAAAAAVIQISLRSSVHQAVRVLYELQPVDVEDALLSQLFANHTALSNELLLEGVQHRSPSVRREVVALLRRRNALPDGLGEQLLGDQDAGVRWEALQFLQLSGRHFSKDEAKAHLVKPTQNPLGWYGSSDSGAEKFFADFERQSLTGLTDRELTMLASGSSFDAIEARIVLDERRFAKRKEGLRRAIDDRFREEFDAFCMRTESDWPGQDFVEKTRKLGDFLRAQYVRLALDVLCRKAEPDDLVRVRNVLQDRSVKESGAGVDYAFFAKVGEWEDIPLLIDLSTRSQSLGSFNFLASGPGIHVKAAVQAIVALSKGRADELLRLTMSDAMLVWLVAEISERDFRSLEDGRIVELLRSESASVREAVAVKSIASLSKARVGNLLASYKTRSFRYYNVIHWLDMGLSMPRTQAMPAARRQVSRIAVRSTR